MIFEERTKTRKDLYRYLVLKELAKASAEGSNAEAIARNFGMYHQTVRKILLSFEAQGLVVKGEAGPQVPYWINERGTRALDILEGRSNVHQSLEDDQNDLRTVLRTTQLVRAHKVREKIILPAGNIPIMFSLISRS